MKYWVYVLNSKKDNTFYVGLSKDPYRSLIEHNAGNSKYTKGHIPYILVYKEEHSDRISARKREKYFKSGSGRLFFKKNIFPCSSVGTRLPLESKISGQGAIGCKNDL